MTGSARDKRNTRREHAPTGSWSASTRRTPAQQARAGQPQDQERQWTLARQVGRQTTGRRLARQGNLLALCGVVLMLALIVGRLVSNNIGVAQAAAGASSWTSANPSTAPLLPGESLWNGAPSYLFGNNDAFPWGSNTMDSGTYAAPIQATLKSQHMPIVRQWFFQNSLTNGTAISDAEQLALAQVVANSGGVCFAQLYTSNTLAYDLHLVSLLRGKCELYEVMNEPDSAGVSAAQYSSFWNSFVPQARALDPNARFGGPATTVPLGYDCTWDNSGHQTCFLEKWLQNIANVSHVYPDFVTFHWYTCWNEDAATCLSKAGNIKGVGNSTIALVNKYLPGRNIPAGLTEWNANAGNPSYQYDDAWMSQYESASLAALEQSGLSFAMQYDIGSYAGWGSLDMFNVGGNGAERLYGQVWAAEVAREINGGVSSGGGSGSGSTPTPSTPPSPTSTAATPTTTSTTTPIATATPTSPSLSTLFSDDFGSATLGATPAAWQVVSGAYWSVQPDGTSAANPVLQQGNPSTAQSYTISAGTSTWTDYTVQASVRPGANDLNQPTILMARWVDNNTHYSFLLKNHDEWYLGKRVGGTWTTLAQGTFTYTSQWYTLALSVVGQTISGSINGAVVASVTDASVSSGKIAFQTNATSAIDNVLVTAPDGSGSSPTTTPTPALTVSCAEVISGELTLGQCGGTFTAGAPSGSGAVVCLEEVNNAMTLGTCDGTFTRKP